MAGCTSAVGKQQQLLSWPDNHSLKNVASTFLQKKKKKQQQNSPSLSVCIPTTLCGTVGTIVSTLTSRTSVWVTSETSAVSSSHLTNSRSPPVTQGNFPQHCGNVTLCLGLRLCSDCRRIGFKSDLWLSIWIGWISNFSLQCERGLAVIILYSLLPLFVSYCFAVLNPFKFFTSLMQHYILCNIVCCFATEGNWTEAGIGGLVVWQSLRTAGWAAWCCEVTRQSLWTWIRIRFPVLLW